MRLGADVVFVTLRCTLFPQPTDCCCNQKASTDTTGNHSHMWKGPVVKTEPHPKDGDGPHQDERYREKLESTPIRPNAAGDTARRANDSLIRDLLAAFRAR